MAKIPDLPSNTDAARSEQRVNNVVPLRDEIPLGPREATPNNALTKKRVVSGRVMRRKPSNPMLAQMGELGQYVWKEVAVPAIKVLIQEVILNAVDITLFGEPRPKSKKKGDTSITSYQNYYDNKAELRPKYRLQNSRARRIENIILENRRDAMQTLDAMKDLISTFGVVSVSDYYDLVGFTEGNWVDADWGWDDLDSVTIRPSRGGYILDLPAPESLK